MAHGKKRPVARGTVAAFFARHGKKGAGKKRPVAHGTVAVFFARHGKKDNKQWLENKKSSWWDTKQESSEQQDTMAWLPWQKQKINKAKNHK